MLLLALLALVGISGTESLRLNQAPYNTSAIIGGNATLACSVSDKQGSENVKWYRTGDTNALTLNEVPVNSDGHYLVSGTYNLVIVNVSTSDQGSYTCDAAGSSYDGSLTAVDLPTNMTVYWVTSPVADSTSNITCYASRGHPPPTLSWYTNDVAVDSSHAIYTATTDDFGYGDAISTLPVSLRSSDEGSVIKCVASYPDLDNAMSANLTTTFSGKSGAQSPTCDCVCKLRDSMEKTWTQKLTPSLAYWYYTACGVQSCPDFAAFAADVVALLKTELCPNS